MLLVDELYATLQATEKSRVINVSSLGHKGFPGMLSEELTKIDTNDFFNEKTKFDGQVQYILSKFANVVFTRALARLASKEPNGMKSVSLHPGTVGSNLFRGMNQMKVFFVVTLFKPFYMTVFEGAQNNIFTCCVDFMQLQNGMYYDKMKVGRMNPNSDSEKYQN